MGGKKKHAKPAQKQQIQKQVQKEAPASKQANEGKRFVNLLHVYTIYKQKFRRITKEEYEELIRHGCKGKRAAIELSKEFMKAKQVPEEIIDFEKNVGFLCVPRLMPLIALLAERSGYKLRPSLVRGVIFTETPARFQEKFSHLMVYGFWFLGRVISDSLSVKEQVNRGNMFNFSKGDMGYWWAAVRIMDWNCYVHGEKKPERCYSFVCKDPPKYRHYTSRAITNMHQHPMYFLSKQDWHNYTTTIRSIRHNKVVVYLPSFNSDDSSIAEEEEGEDFSFNSAWNSYEDEYYDGEYDSEDDLSSLSSGPSVNTLASRESVD